MWLDNASAIDMLFYSPYADTIVKFTKNSKLTPLTIGLYGSWGAGKSSLLKIIEEKLTSEDKVVCISLNAWQFEGYEDAKIAIMEALLKSLNENENFSDKAKQSIKNLIKRIDFLKLVKNLAKKGLPYALGALTGNPLPIALNLSAEISNADNIIDDINNFKNNYLKAPDDDSEVENIRKFREEFEKMLNEAKSVSNLTVIIDDLDRCTPERIIDTLEAIKLFLSVDKTTFIVAVDQRIIEYAVNTKYQKIDGYEISSDYIEKIIQLPIKIPELSPKDIENYLLLLICQLHIHNDEFKVLINFIHERKLLLCDKPISLNDISDFFTKRGIADYCDDITEFENDAQTIEKIKGVVSSSLKGNPRQTKRFLNTFFVRKNLSSFYFNNELDIAIIAKILVLETIDIKLFKKLNEWNKSYNGEIEQLKKLELLAQDPSTELEEDLNKWVKPRVINWLNSEPKGLYKQDLSKYFYLSRESLSSSEDTVSSFSEKEREILFNILNCTKGQEDNRITELQQVGEESQEKIIDEVLNKFKKNEIGLSLISALYVKYKDIQSDICDIIKSKDNKVYGISAVPHLKRMYKYNNSQITKLITFLKSNNRINDQSEKMITESDQPITLAVPRQGKE